MVNNLRRYCTVILVITVVALVLAGFFFHIISIQPLQSTKVQVSNFTLNLPAPSVFINMTQWNMTMQSVSENIALSMVTFIVIAVMIVVLWMILKRSVE